MKHFVFTVSTMLGLSVEGSRGTQQEAGVPPALSVALCPRCMPEVGRSQVTSQPVPRPRDHLLVDLWLQALHVPSLYPTEVGYLPTSSVFLTPSLSSLAPPYSCCSLPSNCGLALAPTTQQKNKKNPGCCNQTSSVSSKHPLSHLSFHG